MNRVSMAEEKNELNLSTVFQLIKLFPMGVWVKNYENTIYVYWS